MPEALAPINSVRGPSGMVASCRKLLKFLMRMLVNMTRASVVLDWKACGRFPAPSNPVHAPYSPIAQPSLRGSEPAT